MLQFWQFDVDSSMVPTLFAAFLKADGRVAAKATKGCAHQTA